MSRNAKDQASSPMNKPFMRLPTNTSNSLITDSFRYTLVRFVCPIRLALFQSYATPSGHSPSRTVSTPNWPHTSKSGPLIVTNVPTVLANAIASSSVGHEFSGSPFLLIILYITRLYCFLNYWSTGAQGGTRTRKTHDLNMVRMPIPPPGHKD